MSVINLLLTEDCGFLASFVPLLQRMAMCSSPSIMTKFITQITLLVAAVVLVSLPTWAQKKNAKPQHLSVAFYNVENLFDTEDDPTIQDEEYLPTSELKWDAERYAAKLKALSRVIDTLGSAPGTTSGPDVLGMCEVENRRVLEDLIKTDLLKAKGYAIVHKNSPDRRGIDVALIYKPAAFKPFRMRWYPVLDAADTAFRTRDILLVSGTVAVGKKTDTLHVFVNHFPSRRGGESSEGKRALVAGIVRTAMDSILTRNAKAKFLAMGDLNDEPTDKSLQEVLRSGAKPAAAWSQGYLYNTMWDLKAAKKGTHYYRGEFSMLDQILVSEGLAQGSGLSVGDNLSGIYNPIWIQQTDEKYKGAPNRTFVGKRYFGGFSDHFPVFLHLNLQ